jgi:autotransporter translocation and assembly factor TamB
MNAMRRQQEGDAESFQNKLNDVELTEKELRNRLESLDSEYSRLRVDLEERYVRMGLSLESASARLSAQVDQSAVEWKTAAAALEGRLSASITDMTARMHAQASFKEDLEGVREELRGVAVEAAESKAAADANIEQLAKVS